MSLEARVGIRRGSLTLDVGLDAEPGETVVLLGPNGAGKTTLLRALAGLLPLDLGRITVDGQVLDDPLRGAWTPADRRPIGFVFQDQALFPHLSALENVAWRSPARSCPSHGFSCSTSRCQHSMPAPASIPGGSCAATSTRTTAPGLSSRTTPSTP